MRPKSIVNFDKLTKWKIVSEDMIVKNFTIEKDLATFCLEFLSISFFSLFESYCSGVAET